jgi:hypothetical protein
VALYEQPPAPVAEFIDSPSYLDLADQTFPVLKETLERLFAGPYSEAAIAWGIGSGKSYLAALAICYMLHATLCLRDPQRHYGLAPGSPIVFMNMGLNALQARKVVFEDIRDKVVASPWFQRHYPAQVFAGELRFPKNVLVVAGNSAETYPLGFNILGAVLDEASWYPEDDEGRRDIAEEIYNALQRRIRSRFLDRGLLVMISSPRYEDDFLQRKIAEAEWNERIFASRLPAWEVRPARFYSGETFDHEGLAVPVEYADDFRRDPRRALRDIAAQPVAVVCPFFDDPLALERCIDATRAHPVDERGRLRPDFRATDSGPRFIHVDLGLRRDACGLAMATLQETGDRRREPGPTNDTTSGGAAAAVEPYLPPAACRPPPDSCRLPSVVRIEYMERIAPPEGGEVSFEQVRQRIYELRDRGFDIRKVTFDNWQSVDSRQILRQQGFETEELSVDRTLQPYETLRSLVNSGRIRYYRYEPFLRECRRLEFIRGSKADHPPGGSKDVADAVAAAALSALQSTPATIGGRVL